LSGLGEIPAFRDERKSKEYLVMESRAAILLEQTLKDRNHMDVSDGRRCFHFAGEWPKEVMSTYLEEQSRS